MARSKSPNRPQTAADVGDQSGAGGQREQQVTAMGVVCRKRNISESILFRPLADRNMAATAKHRR